MVGDDCKWALLWIDICDDIVFDLVLANVCMKQRIYICVLCATLLVIIFLSIEKDNHYNRLREMDAIEAVKQDSLLRMQIDTIIVLLNKITVQLDSINDMQKEYNELEQLNIDTVKRSLGQLNRIGRRILNMK